MSEKMRLTMHNGRAGKDGVYLASHNDRNFDTKETEHIDSERSAGNWTWHRYQTAEPGLTFEEAEARFYERTFGASLDAQNARHKSAGNYKRVKTMDEYRRGKQTCPEETILQIGNKDSTISPKLLQRISVEQINWEMKTFPNVKLLDAALHVDEQGAPHLHKRQVWVATGKDGLTVSQNKALQEMGLKRPDTSKKESRYNNAKMSYTEQCREHFLSICRKYGLDIETEPKEASKSGLSLLEYQRQQEQEKLEQTKADTDRQKALLDDKKRQDKAEIDKYTKTSTAAAIEKAKQDVDAYTDAKLAVIAEKTAALQETDAQLQRKDAELQRKETELQRKDAELQRKEIELQEKERRLDDRETLIDGKQIKLDRTKTVLTDLRNTSDRAYYDAIRQQEELKKLSDAELKRRTNQYAVNDFGEALNDLDTLVKQMESGHIGLPR